VRRLAAWADENKITAMRIDGDATALGVVGIAFCVIGVWFPTSVHIL